MELLEEILLKHYQQTHEAHTHFTQRDLRVREYKGLYADLLGKQNNFREKSQPCQPRNEPRKGPGRRKQGQCPTDRQSEERGKGRSARQSYNFIVSPRKTLLHLNQFCNVDYQSSESKASSAPKKQFFITMYSKNRRSKLTASHTSFNGSGKQLENMDGNFKLQINRLPITKRQETKRRIIAEALGQRSYLTPQPEKDKRPEPPRTIEASGGKGGKGRRREEMVDICGWEGTDLQEW